MRQAVPFLIAAAALAAVPALAKRTAPPKVAPLVVDGTTYIANYERLPAAGKPERLRVSLLEMSGGAYKVLDKHLVYEIRFKPDLETDVQERFITSLTREEGGILVQVEDKKFYLVDTKARRTIELPSAMDEPAQEGPRLLDRRGKDAKCELHNSELRDGAVPITYGLVRLNPDYQKARAGFPTANSSFMAGCVLRSPRWALVRYCPDCRKRETAWQRQHAGDGKI